jgi:carboxylesterase type B
MFDLVAGLPLTFQPEVDNFTSDPFIPKSSWEIIESGEFNHVPTIIGANAQEGLLSSLFFYKNKTFMDEIAEKWDKSYGPLIIFHR